ncbi:MAG TPA: penicillin-binding protein 2 [Bacteroidales bacterium]|nr:penicillin-binding protein 2 [Bacteroidales bacterium]
MKDAYINRKYFMIVLVVAMSLVLVIKLFRIQILERSYRLSADNNVLRYVTQYPARGLIYDRNGKLVVFNQAAYDIMVVPAQTMAFDTVEFCNLLGITRSLYAERMRAAINYSRRAPSVFLKMVSAETYARLQEKMYRFPGFYVQTRTLRKYSKPVAAHALGYVSEVDDNLVKKEPYYKPGDYIGTGGIEESYEKELRGKKGVKIYLVDVYSRLKGSYEDGRLDTVAVQGSDIVSTIDADLQEYAEHLMQNKSGSIVAIEPKTGEVLALVSAPKYDPSLLVGRVRSENFAALLSDSTQPIFNRALMASYPPGSTFKPVNGLIALQEQVIVPTTLFSCNNGYLIVACHTHESPLNLVGAIKNSCNAYFCQAYRRILDNPKYLTIDESYSRWKDYLDQFGFGRKLGTDFVNELTGFIPQTSFYDKRYGKGRWKSLMIISNAIGQGEVGATPLQIANMAATLANRGYYISPHIVRSVGNEPNRTGDFETKHFIGIDTANFGFIVNGMDQAVNSPGGTAVVAAIRDIRVCGKTGTAQNPHGKDHSIFMAFAPKDDPKIAIAVYVENSGFGATYAAPVASLLIEKYLKGAISNKANEEYILGLNLMKK